MTNQRLGLRVAGAIFAIISVGHLIRLAAHLELRIGGRVIAMWPSALGAAIAAALAVWFWILSKRGSGV